MLFNGLFVTEDVIESIIYLFITVWFFIVGGLSNSMIEAPKGEYGVTIVLVNGSFTRIKLRCCDYLHVLMLEFKERKGIGKIREGRVNLHVINNYLFTVLRFMVLNCPMIVSYSEIPLIVFWMTWNIFAFFLVSAYSFSYHVIIIIVLIIILAFSFYSFDIMSDYGRGVVTIQTLRIIQTLFVWFVISEIALFFSVFWSCFSCNFVLNEFDKFTMMPLNISGNTKIDNVNVNIFYCDVVNIIINTFLLFVSGLCVNMVLFSISLRMYQLSIWYLIISIYLGLLFLGNQFYEFSLLSTTFSTNCYCSSFLLLDSVHFTHVLVGVCLLLIVLFRTSNVLMSSTFTIMLYIAAFYWHFVDIIWFILVRFIYLTI